MPPRTRMESLRRERAAQDPDLVRHLVQVVESPDETPSSPVPENAATLAKFLRYVRSAEFRKRTSAEQAQYRVDQLKALEADDAEAPLPERMRVDELILSLWQSGELTDRALLRDLIEELPLVWGPWRALKRIFKESEAAGDTEIYGALAARIDVAFAHARAGGSPPDAGPVAVSAATLGYLSRRAWRFLRRAGQSLPATYPDLAGDVLACYPDGVNWRRTWIANHIFHHATGEYGRSRFHLAGRTNDLLKNRAFAEAWKRSPRPLFSLLERARSEQVRRFATDALKTDFRTALRDVEPAWVARLVHAGSAVIDEFVVWILKHVPQLEQSKFRELGLHDAVLRLFASRSSEARGFAVEYVRTHARDVPLPLLIRLADNSDEAVQKLACDLLRERDPRKDVGLESWGQLLDTEGAQTLAAETLRKHYTAAELTPEWFQARLLEESDAAREFARDHLTRVHAAKSLGPGYFIQLVERAATKGELIESYCDASEVIAFALGELERFDLQKMETDALKLLLLQEDARVHVLRWIDEGKLKPAAFPVDFLKTIAFHPDWDASPEIARWKQNDWARRLAFSESLSQKTLAWLGDVRAFSPVDLTFDWLLKLVQRSEPQYHDFAVETMIKVFLPADFAPRDDAPAAGAESPKSTEGDAEPEVDLGGASFLFTGKLSTMTRDEAEGKVTRAKGANASSVSPKLNYLVIGDEGSPLYGQGRKGSKQTKAESLIASGAGIKIISETAFLQMLIGGKREFSTDQVERGCERLWAMLTGDGSEDAPLRKFARQYIRRHHPEICLKETDRPVDPGAEIPPDFLTFDRVKPLFFDKRKLLRDFALELAGWEFARWSPPIEGLVELCEAPAEDVREFVARALTIEDLPENRRFRLNADVLTSEAVYSFCESRDAATRMLGMHLIEKNPRLQLPEELFQLTESPDRRVRAFVIRAFWSLYRDRGITDDWKPRPPKTTTIGRKAKEKAQQASRDVGTGAPQRPAAAPAPLEELRVLLRRVLFEIPPGRPEAPASGTISTKLKPLPTRRTKILLVESLRDLAMDDPEFARFVLPLLEEFLGSFGASEFAACFVAVTRLKTARPDIDRAPGEGAAT